MSGHKFDDRLGGYVEVKDRIRMFYEKHPDGRLSTGEVREFTFEDGPYVAVQAYAYRTPDDPHPGVGWSWMRVPGSTPYTRGSELENTETSAWGRAIGALGIAIDKSIASAQEVASKSDTGAPAGPSSTSRGTPDVGPWKGTTGSGQPPADGQLRQTPDGDVFGFTLVGEDNKRLQVLAQGGLAVALAGIWRKGVPATVEGTLTRVPWQKDGKDMPPYRRVIASKVTTAEYVVPAEDAKVSDDDLDKLPF